MRTSKAKLKYPCKQQLQQIYTQTGSHVLHPKVGCVSADSNSKDVSLANIKPFGFVLPSTIYFTQ